MTSNVSGADDTTAVVNVSLIAAEVAGWMITLGSALLYTPMIFRVIRKQSAEGLSTGTWWMKFTAYSSTLLYNIVRGFPLNTYAEVVVISLQAFSMLLLVMYLQNTFLETTNVAFGALYAAVALVLYASPALLNAVLPLAAVYAASVATFAIVPQIILNCRRRSGGEFSPITALLASIGNLLRVFTTLAVTGDALLLVGFSVGSLINLTLLVQMIVFWSNPSGSGSDSASPADSPPRAAATGSWFWRFWLSDVLSVDARPGEYRRVARTAGLPLQTI